jgi:hypothetical protein
VYVGGGWVIDDDEEIIDVEGVSGCEPSGDGFGASVGLYGGG